MHILFGIEFDGGSYPDELAEYEARLGIIHLGPLGLIDLLETRLGLGQKPVSATVRIGQYLKRLQSISGENFFSKSLAADPWATAKHLLDWRDSLVIAGWDGKADANASARIQTLSFVENASNDELAPGLGERLSKIRVHLEKGIETGISRIDCIEPEDYLPLHWKDAFQLLRNSGCYIQTLLPANAAGSGTDLDILKQKLVGEGIEGNISGDGSIVLLSCANELDGAEFLASWLSAKKDLSDILWITEGGSHILDSCLTAHGLPRLSTDHRSRWRTVLQVLPLALNVRWAPFNPQLFLEWLSLPKLPIPVAAAFEFRKALLEHPGQGGPLWKKARKDVLNKKAVVLKEQGVSNAKIEKEIRKLKEILDFWFENETHDPEIGIPVEIVSQVCQKVASWALAKGKVNEDPLFISAGALATEVDATLKASGYNKIKKPELDRILDYVYADGYKNIDDFAQAAEWAGVSSPGQIRGSADTVIWWGFVDSQSPDPQLPWTQAERSWLENRKIFLEEPKIKRIRKALSWQQAAQFSGKKLILVCPRQIGAEPVTPHPFWDEIHYLLNLEEKPQSGIIQTTDGLYQEQSSWIFGLPVAKEDVVQSSPPTFESLWEIPENTIGPRQKESFSSMDRLIRCPRAWVLQYILGLDPNASLSVPDGNQAVGTLAHKIVEMIFNEKTKPSPEDARKRAYALFDEMVPHMAGTLLQPGREIELGRYRAAMGTAVFHLVDLLNTSGLKYYKSEMPVEKPFSENSSQLTGRIDLVLKLENEEYVFWDLKWSKRAKYKREELENEEALQLAVYSWLLTKGEAGFPPGGYYMLGQAELLSGPCDGLPSECIVGNLDLRGVWQAAKQTFLKRMDDLMQGAVEAGYKDEEAIDSEPADGFKLEAKCDWCDYVHICGEKV